MITAALGLSLALHKVALLVREIGARFGQIGTTHMYKTKPIFLDSHEPQI